MAQADEVLASSTPWFKIGWWNSRLTPPKGSRLNDIERQLALSVIRMLVDEIDIVFLGEINDKDISWLKAEFRSERQLSFDWSPNTLSRGRFNIGVIYRNDIVRLSPPSFKLSTFNCETHKIAVEFDAEIFGEMVIRFLVSHWPSRARQPAEYENRAFLGDRLRQEVDRYLSGGQANLILIGDYNDEPYNRSVANALGVTRHPGYLQENGKLLYNPFWKHMIAYPGNNVGQKPSATGTYFYRQTPLNKWLVFDQMMFSSGFTGNGNWHLMEESVQVVRPAELVKAIEGTSSKLDHLPIVAAIKKVNV